MSKTTNFVFKALQVVAWIIFTGLCIEAGALLVNFFISLYNPAFVKNLYQKLDLSDMYGKSKFIFYSTYGLILLVAVLKALLFNVLIRLVRKIDLSKPFSEFASKQISLLSYYTLTIGLLSYFGSQYEKSLMHHGFITDNLNKFWTGSEAFILMGGVIYIIATIFKKGVEIQTENELTV